MTRPDADTAVIIPARNEAKRIAGCIDAIADQADGRTVVHVVVNNSDDDTATLARNLCRDHGLPARIIEIDLVPGEGVGTARRIGAEQALREMDGLKFLLSTDADSMVAPDWLARNLRHLDEVDAVCGKIGPLESETESLSGMNHALAELEGRYRALVLRFYQQNAPERHSPAGHHGEASGASLAFRASSYAAVGGFGDIRTGEDREIIRRLKQRGFAVRHADDVLVRTSHRLRGRAPGGMAETLRARVGVADYAIDECLPPAEWLWQRCDWLPVWPHDGSGYDAIRVSDLSPHIARLEALIAAAASGCQYNRVGPGARPSYITPEMVRAVASAPPRHDGTVPTET